MQGALYPEDYGMAILDEINNAIAYGLLPVNDVLEGLKSCGKLMQTGLNYSLNHLCSSNLSVHLRIRLE